MLYPSAIVHEQTAAVEGEFAKMEQVFTISEAPAVEPALVSQMQGAEHVGAPQRGCAGRRLRGASALRRVVVVGERAVGQQFEGPAIVGGWQCSMASASISTVRGGR